MAKADHIEAALPRIYTFRKLRVVLDADLARLYEVPTFRFNEAVKRNTARFPEEFRFQLTAEETAHLISQSAISSGGHGGLRKRPWVFTEHGALMAATVLRSERAVQMSIYVIRAFVKLRDELTANLGVLRRLSEIDKKLIEHDVVLREVLERLQPLLNPPPEKPKPKIGFHRGNR